MRIKDPRGFKGIEALRKHKSGKRAI